ncbi:hypothetical protein TREPR_3431 [Treponema primitia ZAS-2]|uniref:Uncharacterized protein n=1 Tax=Treponema primitia (strain ATCC BAA-887 / DSM 12427 / ZAS-2) TaxID=545694 RepID=F5YJI6_TREPZ|nr:hypothetical protein [Treponema primitia]AEF83669.1 hypothetical protein TREPR_3431 [Treponema primitia ZAS-2]
MAFHCRENCRSQGGGIDEFEKELAPYRTGKETGQKDLSMILKNICINSVLLIASAIIYLFYEKYFTEFYIDSWPSIFLGVVVVFIILFSNITGLLSSIIKIQTTGFTIINYMLLIISTIVIYKTINIIAKILEDKKIVSECSIILLLGILIVIENVISNYIGKIINNRETKMRATSTGL